jgi:hypothetical protein
MCTDQPLKHTHLPQRSAFDCGIIQVQALFIATPAKQLEDIQDEHRPTHAVEPHRELRVDMGGHVGPEKSNI